jgi:CubicO group peptidase (beta-lactamase class C family)
VIVLARDGSRSVRMSLDDTVERWLPGLVPGGAAITVRQLLNHTSGLFDYMDDGDNTILRPYLRGDVTHFTPPRRIVEVATSIRRTSLRERDTGTRTPTTSCSGSSRRR